MDLVKKDVKYLNKDFAQFRQNLINFAKQYYPDSYQDFNESSPGMMFIEMASYVGDVLSYYSDQSFRESLLSSATEEANILQIAQMFGYKPTLNAPAVVDLDVFQLVPAIGTGDNAAPDTRYALSIQSNMRVQSETGVVFRTLEQVDFSQDTVTSPLDVSVYEVDVSNNVTYYLYKKTVKAVAGEVKTLSFNFQDPKPYDKIILPDTNVLDIISVTSDTGNKFYQVDYLAQDTIFEDVANVPFNDPTLSDYRSTVPYILKLRRTARRFVSRVRDDKRIELQFGAGVSSDADEELIPNPKNVGMGLEYLNRTTLNNVDPTNFLHTSTYGIAPNNETLTVQYSVGGSVNENVSVNSITSILEINYNTETEVNNLDLAFVKGSVAINNSVAATGGKTSNNLDSIRQDAMAAFAAQNRAITREDYIARCYSMPAKFGSVAKAYIIGDTQKDTADKEYPRDTISNPMALNLYTLSYDANGNFVDPNPAIRENLRTYLSNYRMLTDAINIKKAYVVNIGVEFEVIPKPTENSATVVLRCVDELKRILHNDRMQINGPLNISNMISQLDRLEGVQSIPSLEITNLYDTNNGYSGNVYDINAATKNNIVYPSLDPCIFEVKYPNADIKGRVVKP
jgi:hypothetical protein